MAFASVGTLGSALSSGNNQSTLVLTTSAAAEVGNLVVVAIAVDNRTGTEGASTDVSGVSDNSTSGPNNWQRAVGFTNTNGGAAQDGADISIWYATITTQINNGGTITATFTSATTSDATAMSAWEFTVAGGVAIEATNTLANDAAAAGSLDATTSNIACLRFRATASESNSTTVWTKTAAFDSLITQAVSGAGTSATEMGVRGEFDISTGTGSASAPTGGAGAVDNASAYVAFKETTAHVGEARFAGAGSFSAQAVKKPSEATFAGNGAIVYTPEAATLNMAAQERLGGAGSFSINVTGGSVETIFIHPLTNRAPPRRKIPPVELRHFGVQLVADTIKVGEANFTGSGNFSANALLLHASRAIFAGAGSLSINAILAQPGQATFAGTGSLSVNITARLAAQATFAGAGSFSVDAVKSAGQSGEATFAGVGNFRVLAQLIQPAFATFQGSGNVSVNANLRMVIQAQFNGAGSFSVDTLQSGTKAGEARFNGAGNLSVEVTQISAAVTWGWHRISEGPLPRRSFVYKARQSVAIIYPLDEVTVEWMQPASRAPTRRDIPAIDLRPFGVQAAAAAAANQIEARFEGAGGFRVNVTQRHVEGARFNGAGSLSVDAAKQGTQSGEATFQGTGNFRVNVLQAHASQATFAGSGSFSVNVTALLAAQATFAGAGNLSVEAKRLMPTAATFAGTGSLSINVTARFAIQATFQGTGNLSVEATIAGAATQHSGNAVFNGAGNFSVNVLQAHSSQARFVGAGNYSVNVTQQHVEGARFNGVGSFSVDATQVAQSIQQAEARFNGVGNLSVNVVQAHVEGARFAGAGNVSARLVQGLAASAIFGGVGSLSVDATQVSTYKFGEATFAGSGNFRVNVTAKYAADVRFTGTGNLLCNVIQRHTAQARFAGAGSFSANAGQVSTHQGQARFNGAGSFSVNPFVLAFGSSLIEATFHGEGGMIIGVTVTGPRHVQSTRPVQVGPIRHNTAYTGRTNLARGGRRNVA